MFAFVACAVAIPAIPQAAAAPQPINPAEDLAEGADLDLKGSSSYGYGYYGGLYGGYPYGSAYGGYGGYPFYNRYYSGNFLRFTC